MKKDNSLFLNGNSTGVLLIHGLGGTPVEMRYLAQGLNKLGYTVYCPTLYGHSDTLDKLKNSTYINWVSSVDKSIEKLKKRCSNIFVGGLSAGSLLSINAAIDHTLDGIILYSPTIVLNGWSMPWYMPLLHYLRPSFLNLDMNLLERYPYGLKDDRIRDLVLNSMNKDDTGYLSTPLSTMLNFNVLSSKIRKKIDQVDCPILIFHPKEDDVSSIKNSYEIIKKSKTRVELVVLEDSYHIVTLDKQRNLVIEKTGLFVKHIVEEINKRQNNTVYKIQCS